MHGSGGASAGKDAAERRVTYAQLVGDDRRHPQEILLDMTHKADVLTRLCEADMLAAGNGMIDADQRAQLVHLIRTTHGLAAQTIGTKAYDDASHAFTRHLELEGQLVGNALGAAIEELGLTEPWRQFALEVAHWTLLGEGDQSHGDRPQPPSEPIVQEYDVRPLPAIEAGLIAQPQPYDVTHLDDDALAELAGRVLDERNRRNDAP